MNALIDAAAVPDLPADPAALIAAADAMAPAALNVHRRVDDAVARWRTLPAVFDTPETEAIVDRLQPVSVAATDFSEATATASVALRTLGENLRALEWTRARLIEEIAAHRSTVLANRDAKASMDDAGDPLAEWGPYGYSQNEDLEERCGSLRRSFRAALEECEQDLGRIGDVDHASPVMWGWLSPQSSLLTWSQESSEFESRVSMGILHRLASASADDVSTLLTEHPDWLTMLRDRPPAPREVADWWRSLDASQSAALVAGASLVIGNLEGVAYSARDVANRTALQAQIEETRAALAAEEARDKRNWGAARGGGEWRGGRGAELRDRLANLLNIEETLRPPVGRAPRYLLSFSADRPPLAAVSIGNPDTASNVTYAIPGMGTTTRSMTGWTNAAQNLFDEQLHAAPERDSAVVAWIGYRTPPIPLSQGQFEVMSNDLAQEGAEKLSKALAGLVATRDDPVALNIAGHSYGTTTGSIALTLAGTPRVETFVAMGSAGLPETIDSASDLNVDSVYTGQARNVLPGLESGQGDQWAWVGRLSPEHPVDPASSSFGGRVFGADGDNGMRPVTDHIALVGSGEGWGYFDLGTEALRNAALALSGRGNEASPAIPKGFTPTQEMWKDVMSSPGLGL